MHPGFQKFPGGDTPGPRLRGRGRGKMRERGPPGLTGFLRPCYSLVCEDFIANLVMQFYRTIQSSFVCLHLFGWWQFWGPFWSLFGYFSVPNGPFLDRQFLVPKVPFLNQILGGSPEMFKKIWKSKKKKMAGERCSYEGRRLQTIIKSHVYFEIDLCLTVCGLQSSGKCPGKRPGIL